MPDTTATPPVPPADQQTTQIPSQDTWTPPSKEDYEKLQQQLSKLSEDNENYKKGLVALKKEKKLESTETKEKKDDVLTRSEFEKINERKAINEMVAANPELEEHWDEVMAQFAQRKGRSTSDDIKSDIQDALDLWRLRKNKGTGTESNPAAQLASQNGIGRSTEVKQEKTIDPKNDADRGFLAALSQNGVDLKKLTQ